jgi:drug/metabolite transporter (DMT)-like permease
VKHWGRFILLGLVWGSSFLWIKIAVGNNGRPFLGVFFPVGAPVFGPFLLVTFRLLFGLLGLAAVIAWQRTQLPRDPQVLGRFAIMGVLNTALPFVLISWGETRIDSGLASILNGTVPLFTIVIAHFWLHDERITTARLLGLVVGFVGVVVLVSRDLGSTGQPSNIWGELAVVAAAAAYGTAAVFSRKYLRGQSPIAQSFQTLVVAFLCVALAVPVAESPVVLPRLPVVWFAVTWLGLLGSCLAYLLYFSLINAWGPTRASLVTYTFPIVGLLLGTTLLGERLDWRLFLGTALVVGGIVIVNVQTFAQILPVTTRPAFDRGRR